MRVRGVRGVRGGWCVAAAAVVGGVGGAAAGQTVRSVAVEASDLVWEPWSGRLFASVPSAAGGGLADSAVPIDPWSAALASPIAMGVDPGVLAVSDDGQYLYAGLRGEGAIERVDLASRTIDRRIMLENIFFGGQLYADDIEVMPGSPQTIAVSRRRVGSTGRHEGVAIFDNDVRRPKLTTRQWHTTVLEFGNDPSTLYGFDNETTGWQFQDLRVDEQGVEIIEVHNFWFNGFDADFVFDGELAISTRGRAVVPELNLVLPGYGLRTSATTSVASDPANDRVFFLTGDTVWIYDRDDAFLLGSITVPGASSQTFDLWRWGADGLAFRDAGTDRVWLVNGAMVPGVGSGVVVGMGLVVGGRRRRV